MTDYALNSKVIKSNRMRTDFPNLYCSYWAQSSCASQQVIDFRNYFARAYRLKRRSNAHGLWEIFKNYDHVERYITKDRLRLIVISIYMGEQQTLEDIYPNEPFVDDFIEIGRNTLYDDAVSFYLIAELGRGGGNTVQKLLDNYFNCVEKP